VGDGDRLMIGMGTMVREGAAHVLAAMLM
jgi:hypothetical protein